MRSFLIDVTCPLIATAVFWAMFGACVDAPLDGAAPLARLVVTWDPLTCGDPHHVELELALDADPGGKRSVSAPCELGGLTFDAAELGTYRGRLLTWQDDTPGGTSLPVAIAINSQLVRWEVAPTP